MNVGLKIKELRTELKITQEELAKAVQVSTQAVSKWECGGLPDIELVPKIAVFFNVTTDELFGIPVNDYKNIDQKLCNYINSLSDVKERFIEIFALCYHMEISVYDKMDLTQYNVKEIMEGHYLNSQLLSKEGMILTQLKKDKPFFAIFPKLDNEDYNGFLKNKNKFLEFIQELSKEDFFNALLLINSRINNSFTVNLFVKELAISMERAQEIIKTLIKFKLLNVTKLELDDKTIETYTLFDNPAILGFLAFLDMLVEKPNAFYYSNNGNDGNYFNIK
ncbi:MAG: helix-turn-helix transcriptional regulator [Bacilli bacterium]|jgi:transcriptional regulator with XRE-family HTH domain|nr:helix-turn-helix transcriptional regulator [Acholeplasmataceae bacterium]